MAKKKKAGRIAVPFLVTIFIGLIIIGGGAYGVYKYFGLGSSKELSEPTPRQVATSTYEDNHTVLLILSEPDLSCSSTFMLMRSIPKDKRLIFIGIPSNTISLIDGRQQSIKSAFESGGPSSAVDFTENVFGITVDRYFKMKSETLVKLCDIIGGVTYPVAADMAGFNSDGSNQYLNGQQIEKFITYSMFDDGEIQRAYVTSSLAADMINQADGIRIADNFDNNFNTIINMESKETNITAVDYRKHKTAIKNMFERGTSVATFLILDGTEADSDYIISEAFINNLKDQYFKDDAQ